MDTLGGVIIERKTLEVSEFVAENQANKKFIKTSSSKGDVKKNISPPIMAFIILALLLFVGFFVLRNNYGDNFGRMCQISDETRQIVLDNKVLIESDLAAVDPEYKINLIESLHCVGKYYELMIYNKKNQEFAYVTVDTESKEIVGLEFKNTVNKTIPVDRCTNYRCITI